MIRSASTVEPSSSRRVQVDPADACGRASERAIERGHVGQPGQGDQASPTMVTLAQQTVRAVVEHARLQRAQLQRLAAARGLDRRQEGFEQLRGKRAVGGRLVQCGAQCFAVRQRCLARALALLAGQVACSKVVACEHTAGLQRIQRRQLRPDLQLI